MVHVQQGSLETLTVCSDSQSFGFPTCQGSAELTKSFPSYTQNPLQYCKVISLQLIKINEKKWIVTSTEDPDFHSEISIYGNKLTKIFPSQKKKKKLSFNSVTYGPETMPSVEMFLKAQLLKEK